MRLHNHSTAASTATQSFPAANNDEDRSGKDIAVGLFGLSLEAIGQTHLLTPAFSAVTGEEEEEENILPTSTCLNTLRAHPVRPAQWRSFQTFLLRGQARIGSIGIRLHVAQAQVAFPRPRRDVAITFPQHPKLTYTGRRHPLPPCH
jgi:hypothetical protein